MSHDDLLRIALAKMLPEKIVQDSDGLNIFYWLVGGSENPSKLGFNAPRTILDTEWLHVCREIEQKKLHPHHDDKVYIRWQAYKRLVGISDSWQQRADALCNVEATFP